MTYLPRYGYGVGTELPHLPRGQLVRGLAWPGFCTGRTSRHSPQGGVGYRGRHRLLIRPTQAAHPAQPGGHADCT